MTDEAPEPRLEGPEEIRAHEYERTLQAVTRVLLASAASEARVLHARNEAIRAGDGDDRRMALARAHREAEATTKGALEKLVTTHLVYLEGG